MDELQSILEAMAATYLTFAEDSMKHLNGNKSAGTRARKATLKLEKLGKKYRKLSVTN